MNPALASNLTDEEWLRLELDDAAQARARLARALDARYSAEKEHAEAECATCTDCENKDMEIADLLYIVHWAYSKLHDADSRKPEDVQMLYELKLRLTRGFRL